MGDPRIAEKITRAKQIVGAREQAIAMAGQTAPRVYGSGLKVQHTEEEEPARPWVPQGLVMIRGSRTSITQGRYRGRGPSSVQPFAAPCRPLQGTRPKYASFLRVLGISS